MPATMLFDKKLAEAVAELVDAFHRLYPGIKIKTIPPYEDEDFTLEISIPPELSIEDVENKCNIECVKIEDRYDLFIFPKVISAN